MYPFTFLEFFLMLDKLKMYKIYFMSRMMKRTYYLVFLRRVVNIEILLGFQPHICSLGIVWAGA